MEHINKIINRIVKDHHMVFFIGVMLILMGLVSIGQNMLDLSLDMSYGLLALGVFNIVLACTFIIMGTANIETALEIPKEEPGKVKPDIAELIVKLEQRIARLEQGE